MELVLELATFSHFHIFHWQGHTHGRLRHSTARKVYREDAKGKRGSFRPRQTDRASCEADMMPEGCFAISASSANLAKDAHRGRHGTSCPAMPPLRLAGARIAPAPRESAGRFTPVFFKKEKASQEKRAAPPQHCKDARPFSPFVSSVPLSLSRVFAYLSGRWVTCHLQARRQACTARVKPSFCASLMSLLSLLSLDPRPRASARKPCKGDQNTAGGERSVTPGNRTIKRKSPSRGRGQGGGHC